MTASTRGWQGAREKFVHPRVSLVLSFFRLLSRNDHGAISRRSVGRLSDHPKAHAFIKDAFPFHSSPRFILSARFYFVHEPTVYPLAQTLGFTLLHTIRTEERTSNNASNNASSRSP